MFLGALRASPSVHRRLAEWADAVWPRARKLETGDAVFWHDGGSPFLASPIVTSPALTVAIDGCLWRDESSGATVSSEEYRRFGRDLLAGTWPIEGWDGSFAAVALGEDGACALAVDPVGLRRLYYASTVGYGLVFGSLAAPCARAVGASPDPEALACWLGAFIVPGSRTLFREIREVLPGERLLLRPETTIERRVDRSWHHRSRELGLEEAAEELVPVLRRQGRRMAVARVGVALSSGIDSRLVLGTVVEGGGSLPAYTYGDPREAEMRLAARCAAAAGVEFRPVDLVGRYFPSLATVRRQALASESADSPFWPAMGAAAEQDGIDAFLLGDITNCLQTRAPSLWSRRERLRRRLGPIASEPRRRLFEADEWLRSEVARTFGAARHVGKALGLELDETALEMLVQTGYEEVAELASLRSARSLPEAEERLYLVLERQRGGAQARALGGRFEIAPVFSTPGLVRRALEIPIRLRADRGLLRALVRRLLPVDLARVPTATVPWCSPLAPLWRQDLVWGARFFGDAALHGLSRRLRTLGVPERRLRERAVSVLSLAGEYSRVIGGPWTQPWSLSGIFDSRYHRRRIERTARGDRPPLVPFGELRAVASDALLAAAEHGVGAVLDSADNPGDSG